MSGQGCMSGTGGQKPRSMSLALAPAPQCNLKRTSTWSDRSGFGKSSAGKACMEWRDHCQGLRCRWSTHTGCRAPWMRRWCRRRVGIAGTGSRDSVRRRWFRLDSSDKYGQMWLWARQFAADHYYSWQRLWCRFCHLLLLGEHFDIEKRNKRLYSGRCDHYLALGRELEIGRGHRW